MNTLRTTLLMATASIALNAACLGAENGPVVITEIMYNPHDADEGQEWVEIYNPTAATINLSGWYLENNNGQTSAFAAGTTLGPNAVAVITPRRGGVLGGGSQRRSTYVNTPTAWATAWGPGIQLVFVESFWDYPADPVPVTGTLGGLTNSPLAADALQLRDASGRLVDEVAYLDDEGSEKPWPDDDDAGSIQLVRDLASSVLDNNNGAAWRLSEAGDALGSLTAHTALPAFAGIISAGTPGRLPNSFFVDCNGNGIGDAVDIVRGTAIDSYPFNNIPDSCEGDCDRNALPDMTEVLLDWRLDRNHNAAKDACEINARGGVGGIGGALDTNANGILDSFEAKPDVVITEIMYNPAGSDEGKEFVEIYNAGAAPVDIGNWRLRDLEGDAPTGPIPAGTFIQPGEAVVLFAGQGPGVPADIATQFRAAWGLSASVRSFGLNPWQDRAQRATNIEEVLALVDASGEPVDVADYENPASLPGSTWPATDGASSIYLRSGAIGKTANDLGANWALSISHLDGAYDSTLTSWFSDIRSTGSTGSPGIVWRNAPQHPSGAAVMTEIMYNPNSSTGALTRNEWVEIYNPGSAAIDLSGWYLRDEDGRTGPIPPGTTLGPDELCVLIPRGGAASAALAESDFRAAWGDICRVVALTGWSDVEALPNLGGLTNSPAPGKEVLTLRGSDGSVADIVNYDDDGVTWPADAVVAPPGLGTAWSIYLMPGAYTAVANDIGTNWRAGVQGIDLAFINGFTTVFNGFDLGSPGLLADVVNSPSCAPSTCIADFNQDGGVDGADVESFFRLWETGESGADVNADGGVDGGDVEAFFTAWEAGGCG